MTFFFLFFFYALLIETSNTRDSRNFVSFWFNAHLDSDMMMRGFVLFEEAGVHLVWCFENEKKGLSYIWKCPGNEQRVKKITAECCLFNSESSLLFYEPFLFFDWLPWRDSNKEVWNTPGWKAEYVKSMDHWSKIFILQLNFLARALYKWKETLMITADASDCRHINESPRGLKYFSTLNINGGASLYRTGATDLTKFPNSSFQ